MFTSTAPTPLSYRTRPLPTPSWQTSLTQSWISTRM